MKEADQVDMALKAVVDAKAFAKATKSDDAEVPVYLWNGRIVGDNAREDKVKALNG